MNKEEQNMLQKAINLGGVVAVTVDDFHIATGLTLKRHLRFIGDSSREGIMPGNPEYYKLYRITADGANLLRETQRGK